MLEDLAHGGAEGQALDIEIQAKEMVRNRELMNEIIAKHTGGERGVRFWKATRGGARSRRRFAMS